MRGAGPIVFDGTPPVGPDPIGAPPTELKPFNDMGAGFAGHRCPGPAKSRSCGACMPPASRDRPEGYNSFFPSILLSARIYNTLYTTCAPSSLYNFSNVVEANVCHNIAVK